MPALVAAPVVDQAAWIMAPDECVRPEAKQRRAIDVQLRAWVGRTVRGEHVDDDQGNWQLTFGCVDRAGIVVDVQADLVGRAGTLAGHWWVVRLTGHSIHVLAAASGEAVLDCCHSDRPGRTVLTSVETVVLADLDGDGVLDPVIAREARVDGEADGDVRIFVSRRGRLDEVGRLFGQVADESALGRIASLHFERGDGDTFDIHRCVTTRRRWTRCASDP